MVGLGIRPEARAGGMERKLTTRPQGTRMVALGILHFRLEPLELRWKPTAGLPAGVGVELKAKPGKR